MSAGLALGAVKLLICLSFYAAPLALANSFIFPRGGQVIYADEPFTITWTATSTEPVKLQLLYGDNIVVGNITDSTANEGSLTCTIDSSLAGNRDYYLALCSAKDDPDWCEYTPNGRFSVIRRSSASESISSATSSIGTTTSSDTVSTSILVVTSIKTTAATASATATPSPSSSQSESPDGLPKGTIIAISVVIPVVVLVAAGVAWIIIRKKKKAKQIHVTTEPASPTKVYPKVELPSDNTRAELDSQYRRDQSNGVHELQ